MADFTPEAVLDVISRGHLDCSICMERFTDPKLLKCRHNFCKKCLEDMMEAQRKALNVICCPACRQDTVIPKAGIAGLDSNFTLKALVDEVSQTEILLRRQRSRIICELCVEGKQAVSRCCDCNVNLCQECHTSHKRMKTTNAHEVVTIDDLRSGKATYVSGQRNEIPKCKKHDQQDLIFYCATCSTLICTACAAVDHRAHIVGDISAASTEFEEIISHLLKKVEEKLKKCKAAKDVALQSRNKHSKMVSEKQTAITQKADEDVARIRENERRLKDQLLEISAKKEKQIADHLTQLEENTRHTKATLDRVKNDTFKIIPFDLLKMKDSILHDLEVAEGWSIPDPVRCMTSEDFKQSGTLSQADLDFLNGVTKRPPLQPRPRIYSNSGQKATPNEARGQVTEDEAAITPVEVINQKIEDEAAITPVQKDEDIFVTHKKKFDKRVGRRVIGGGGPLQGY
ncbi:E3 ubiquitin-protein ligase TRIM56-like isoform X2 [Asterias rubens]|uniref:E3 ubiquitin-protein ligase TRIM56-like isoform X2 n=1 Tax=Asterias rubens TaxID=7604 RepID=UPI00145594C7|nr:E3 ubiquitin-protein ligase TRIM56-like isoform X2 [Asterias rubens]